LAGFYLQIRLLDWLLRWAQWHYVTLPSQGAAPDPCAASSVPQILGLLQGAQQGGGLPAGLPGSLPGAQSVGLPGGYSPAQSSPASAVVGGTGPLPGPATVGTR
jgi:hypothetical protein